MGCNVRPLETCVKTRLAGLTYIYIYKVVGYMVKVKVEVFGRLQSWFSEMYRGRHAPVGQQGEAHRLRHRRDPRHRARCAERVGTDGEPGVFGT